MSESKTNEYKPRRQYDEDYKRQAVELTLHGKRTVRQVATELGVTESLLYEWRHRFAPRPGGGTPARRGPRRRRPRRSRGCAPSWGGCKSGRTC